MSKPMKLSSSRPRFSHRMVWATFGMIVHSFIPRLDKLPAVNAPVGAKIMVLIARLLVSLKWMPTVNGVKITSERPAFAFLPLLLKSLSRAEAVTPTQFTGAKNEEEKLTLGVSVL